MIIKNSCDSLQGNHPRVRRWNKRCNKPAMWMIWIISEEAQGPIWLFNFSAIHWEPRSYQEFSNHMVVKHSRTRVKTTFGGKHQQRCSWNLGQWTTRWCGHIVIFTTTKLEMEIGPQQYGISMDTCGYLIYSWGFKPIKKWRSLLLYGQGYQSYVQ